MTPSKQKPDLVYKFMALIAVVACIALAPKCQKQGSTHPRQTRINSGGDLVPYDSFDRYVRFVYNRRKEISMQPKSKGTKYYYGKRGTYLREHAQFLHEANLEKDASFLVKALGLKKRQFTLDIACGQGRHVHALARRGYSVDGVDFSDHLLALAKKSTDKTLKHRSMFYRSDVSKLALKKRYNRAYWFFSDLANINIPKTLMAISRNLEVGGRFLLDTDNVFRLIRYLHKNKKTDFVFNAQRLELVDVRHGLVIPYPVVPMWREWLNQAGLRIERVMGDYQFHPYTALSPRLILIIKKTA
ncbi:hypothetical protein A3D73_00310 [Candidatus Uhrbacteria bacterium RIFCSPHIGHO2_02_FULL_60_44]|nr:MAG: hypothetical protein A3D73_00310 [Candidatus Uhrbacteria bacterium RIFCSPHIGHO2_02_FULL_60_44]